jgi:hypothetical protein
MAKFKNVSSLGDLYIPALSQEVAFGDSVDVVDEEVASSMRDQAGVWQEVSGDSKSTKSTPDAASAAE